MRLPATLVLLALAGGAHATDDSDSGRRWLAGDHHVHSEWSVKWDESSSPPEPIRGGDSPYSRSRNARQALAHGLAWMVHTDHGGPGHSAVTRDFAWPALQQARRDVPSLIQFHGMEFDVPAGEHATLIIAPGPEEHTQLERIERDYNRREPLDPTTRDSSGLMLDALHFMQNLPSQPLMFVNHPARTATGIGAWGKVEPDELRAWQDAAPQVLVGMEGAPGHQANARHRGGYTHAAAPTFGGFDQMTAQVGGVWDTLLAEGRRFWITATSDSHLHQRDGGAEFDPGEYSKTYVWARKEADDILDGLRHGRLFAVTGDLVDALELRVRAADASGGAAEMGGTLALPAGQAMVVELRVRQPSRPNFNDQQPTLDHVEVIVGTAGDDGEPRMQTKHFGADDWRREGQWLSLSWELPAPEHGGFVRVRGTSTDEKTPLADMPGEDPWQDLWFYSNPVFVEVAR
ncbi:hypothetical protein [Luteimonas salinilitoris]|uniref:Phosphoesterase n=1 Tax=Luteimonas salinilitoris TaxID=3237697 RepID=A0ABV4HU96_9GAMM